MLSLLQLLERTCIHHIFHVNLLMKFVGDLTALSLELSLVIDKGVILLERKTILDTCWVKQGDKFVDKSLVH